MSIQAPNLAAVIPSEHAQLITQSRPIPNPGSGELVIRNSAIAANPADWKIQSHEDYFKTYPNVLGSDVAGTVLSIGPSVTKFAVGDRVTGFAAVIYNQNIDHGAWQTYTVLREIATTKIPDSLTFEDASVLPMAVATTAVALFADCVLALPLPKKENAEKLREVAARGAFLVWGAASSVGSMAVQMARALGFQVIGTASKRHHGWIKELGAAVVVDYRDPDVLEQVRKAAKQLGTPIKFALDAVAEIGTFAHVGALVEGGDGAKVATVLPWPQSLQKPDGVQVLFFGAYLAFTRNADVGEYIFNEWLRDALLDGSIKPAPSAEIVPGGVEKAQEVFDKLKAGVSGKKLVVQVA